MATRANASTVSVLLHSDDPAIAHRTHAALGEPLDSGRMRSLAQQVRNGARVSTLLTHRDPQGRIACAKGVYTVVLYQVHQAGKKLQPYREQYHHVFRQASWQMNQGLLNVRTVMDYVQEPREIARLGGLLDRYLELANLRNRVDAEAHRIRDWLLSAARFSVLFYAVYLVYRGSMSTGSLFLFATLSEKVVASLFRLDRLYSYLGDSIESAEQLAHVFAARPNIVDRSGAKPCTQLDGDIEFRNVGFHYHAGRPVLRDQPTQESNSWMACTPESICRFT